MLVGLIVACEIGFWVLLGAGLLARYGLRWPRVSAVLLVSVPLVDLVLLTATVIDLRGGAVASLAHSLAAVYLGFSVAFGHQTIRGADVWIAHRVAHGPAPAKPPRVGPARVRHEWALWRRAVAAWAMACTLLLAAVLLVGDASRTAELSDSIGWLSVTILAWLVAGPVWATRRLGGEPHRVVR